LYAFFAESFKCYEALNFTILKKLAKKLENHHFGHMSDAPAATAVTVTDNGNVERMISMNCYAHDSKIYKRKLYSK